MKLKIWIAMISVYIVWGGTYLAIRFAVKSFPPFMIASVRWLLAGSILYLWMRLSGNAKPSRKQWKTTAVVGLCLLVGGNGLLSWAEKEIASSVAAITIGTVPLWIVVIDALRPSGVKPNFRTVLGVLIGFIGIFILINPFQAAVQFNPGELLSLAALIGAAIFWSIGSIYSRDKHSDLPEKPLMASGMEMLAGAVGLFLVSMILGEWREFNPIDINSQALIGFGYLLIFGSFIGYVSYSWLLGVASTPLVSTYAYVNPLVAVLLGGVLADEIINARILTATIMIVGAVILTNTTRLRSVSSKRKTKLSDIEYD